MYDNDSRCLPPGRSAPENVVVMDVGRGLALVCTPMPVEAEPFAGMIDIFCNHTYASVIVDKNGNTPDPEHLKAFARRQTMNDVRSLPMAQN